MASMNYIQLVNDVLIRLREPEASSVSDTAYVKLIARFVNDSKRVVEDAYNWNALTETLSATTTADVFNYVLVGSGQRFRVIDVINDTSNIFVELAATKWMDQQFLMTTPQKGSPAYYNFNGTNSNGDTQVDLFPIPDGSYNIRFNIIKPQEPLAVNADVLLVPHEPVILGALARAQAERGEDGGVQAGETYQLMRQSLADAIALESGRYLEEQEWLAV
jgi:hypothetical protein